MNIEFDYEEFRFLINVLIKSKKKNKKGVSAKLIKKIKEIDPKRYKKEKSYILAQKKEKKAIYKSELKRITDKKKEIELNDKAKVIYEGSLLKKTIKELKKNDYSVTKFIKKNNELEFLIKW